MAMVGPRIGALGAYAKNVLKDVGIPVAGVGGGRILLHFIKSQKFYAEIAKTMKEWTPLVVGVAGALIVDLLSTRVRLPEEAVALAINLFAGLASESIEVLAGYPFATATEKGKLYVKHLEGVATVVVDGTKCTASQSGSEVTFTCPSEVAEGAYDVVVVGSKKAWYDKIYIYGAPASTSATSRS